MRKTLGFLSRNLATLRWHLLLATALLLAGAAAVSASLQLRTATEMEHRDAAIRQQGSRGRMANVHAEEAQMRRSIEKFREMEARSLFGDERRLEWLEAIDRIKARRRLPELDYELSPRHPIDIVPVQPAAGSHEFMASTMKLRMPLLHEGDLLGFLDGLSADVQAIVLVRRCDLERQQQAVAEQTAALPLHAECRIEWITLREKPR